MGIEIKEQLVFEPFNDKYEFFVGATISFQIPNKKIVSLVVIN